MNPRNVAIYAARVALFLGLNGLFWVVLAAGSGSRGFATWALLGLYALGFLFHSALQVPK